MISEKRGINDSVNPIKNRLEFQGNSTGYAEDHACVPKPLFARCFDGHFGVQARALPVGLRHPLASPLHLKSHYEFIKIHSIWARRLSMTDLGS